MKIINSKIETPNSKEAILKEQGSITFFDKILVKI